MEVGALLREALESRYEIEHVLGRGGMALVYRARDLKHDRLVAIKVLRPEIAASLGGERFLREIQIEARLQHPHILPLYDSGRADGLLYYVMPFVEGETLRQRLDREGQLPVDDAVALAEDVAEALSYAHSHGVVHRDVKPENILLTGGHAVVGDFGIARAVSAAGGKRLTSAGVAVGTPAYMSPEQGNGMEADARSDIYSLGCVLFEMLAGEPPFTGPTAQAIIARHVSERPPSLRIVRPGIPEEIERVIERSLAKVPADRFTTVSRFAESLETAAVTAALPAHRRGGRWAAAAVAVAVAVAAVVVIPQVFFGSDLNPSHYLVGSVIPEGADIDPVLLSAFEYELHGAMRQVPEITLEGTTLVNEKRLEAGSHPLRLADWLRLAKTFGAGRLVVLAVVPGADTTQLRVEVYDTREGEATPQRARIALPASTGDVARMAARAVEQLFGFSDGVISIYASTNDAATRAFAAGRASLRHWDLGEASARFQDAVALDPEYAKANLWLAQVASWNRTPAAEWLVYARRAVAGAERLTDGKERLLARALLALGEHDYPAACERYDSLLALDSLDFDAWFGLGECHAKDPTVVRDATSPSGWRFRTSYHTAMLAYGRALDLVPSFLFAFRSAYSLLADTLLYTSPSYLRPGHRLPPDTGLFAAYPSLHDTLGFVPHPVADVMEGQPQAVPTTHRAAVDWSRRALLLITERWARAFPDSFITSLAYARALELRGDLDGPAGASALDVAERASRLATGPSDSLQAELLRSRLFVRLERFEDAARAARRALSVGRTPTPAEAEALAGLAALLGLANRAAQLSAQTVPLLRDEVTERLRHVPTPVFDTRQRLLGYAGPGAPVDSIAELAARMDRLARVHPVADAQFDCWVRHTPIGFVFPVLRRVSEVPLPECWANNGLLEMQWGLAEADTQRVRRVMDELDLMRRRYLPGDVVVEHVYHQAFLLLEIGDTSRAAEQMDAWLAALRATDQSVTGQALKSGSLVRLFALRAELALRRNDLATARRWAEPVAVLWGGGDPEPRGVAARMDSVRTR